MRRFIDRIFLLLTLLSAILLLLAYLSIYVKPTLSGLLAFSVWPILSVAAQPCAFCLLGTSVEMGFCYSFDCHSFRHKSLFLFLPVFGKDGIEGKDDVKILTYNVNLFPLSAWEKNPPTHKQIFDFIRKESPDIICLQEFYVVDDKFTEKQASRCAIIRYIDIL